MRFDQRPTEEGSFKSAAREHQEILDGLVNHDGSPDYPKINGHIKEKKNQIWGDYKKYFMRRQHRKCCYCEVKLTESTGDVEHFRPKNAVWSIKSHGRELEDLVNIRERTYYETYDSGYWWLTYSWNNYMVACRTCNRAWKSALFPVSKRRRRRPQKGDENYETPLLLDPYGTINPADHLRFDDLGQIEAHQNSEFGRKTIQTCGLDRESLRSSREEKAKRTYRLVHRLKVEENPLEIRQILEDFIALGDAEYIHSGMVRAIFEQEIEMSWAELAASS